MRVLPYLVVFGALAMACKPGDARNDTSRPSAEGRVAAGVDLNGAGATFPYPIYRKWFDEYAAATGVKINYQSIGSGGGIKQLQEQTVDIGAAEAPMSDDEMAKAKGGPIAHIPTVIGAVAVTYNLPGVTGLDLSGDVVADIFLGKLTKWNHPRIAALNPGARLPSIDILVVHRTEGSGTTFIFTDYLAAVSSAWKSGPGTGKSVQWPVGLGGKGNEGVAGTLKQTPGAIGYVELAYATENNLSVASMENAAGKFVAPSTESATAAAAGALAALPANTDYRVSIVNANGADAYPISSFTWLLVYRHMDDPAKMKKLKDFLSWALHDGERMAPALGYASLPATLVSRLDSLVAAIGAGSP
jgi:phosphate transport system substrate-binding protein